MSIVLLLFFYYIPIRFIKLSINSQHICVKFAAYSCEFDIFIAMDL